MLIGLEEELRNKGNIKTEISKQRGKPRAKVEISLKDYDNLNQNNYFANQGNKIKLKTDYMVDYYFMEENGN